MLRGNKVLTSLQLWNCGIGPEDFSELCSALEVNTTLTELDLSDNTLDDHNLASLGKLLIITIAVMTASELVFIMVTENSVPPHLVAGGGPRGSEDWDH